jgi:hypothetical protein
MVRPQGLTFRITQPHGLRILYLVTTQGHCKGRGMSATVASHGVIEVACLVSVHLVQVAIVASQINPNPTHLSKHAESNSRYTAPREISAEPRLLPRLWLAHDERHHADRLRATYEALAGFRLAVEHGQPNSRVRTLGLA